MEKTESKSDRGFKITVSFRKSSSIYFEDVLELAKSFDSEFKEKGSGKSVTYEVEAIISPVQKSKWQKLNRLFEAVRNWKHSNVTFEGLRYKHMGSLQTPMFYVGSCIEARKNRPESLQGIFCRGQSVPDEQEGFFGCRQEEGVKCGYIQSSYTDILWFNFGKFSEDYSTYIINKKQISEIIKESTEGSICCYCPFFSWERINEGVESLPDTIKLDDESLFEKKFSEYDHSKPLGIKPKQQNAYDRIINKLMGDSDDIGDDVPLQRSVPKTKYSDVAAQEFALKEIRNIIEMPLRYGDYFNSLGITPQKGVILYGPPGNGKTLIAKAVAGESNAHLEIINGPEILSKWHGQSEKNIRNIFNNAAKMAPSIILIEEIDSIASSRSEMDQHHDITIISQLLVCLDGMVDTTNIVVIATTNRIDSLDSAILRPGRFDYHILVSLPDYEGRKKILSCHLSKSKTKENLDLDSIASQTDSFSGAEIAAICREAGMYAIQKAIRQNISPNDVVITEIDLEAGLKNLLEKRK